MPIIPVLSKSGGLDLYVFTTEPVKAIEIKEFLEQILFLFKLPITTEVFPKQTRLGTDVNKTRAEPFGLKKSVLLRFSIKNLLI